MGRTTSTTTNPGTSPICCSPPSSLLMSLCRLSRAVLPTQDGKGTAVDSSDRNTGGARRLLWHGDRTNDACKASCSISWTLSAVAQLRLARCRDSPARPPLGCGPGPGDAPPGPQPGPCFAGKPDPWADRLSRRAPATGAPRPSTSQGPPATLLALRTAMDLGSQRAARAETLKNGGPQRRSLRHRGIAQTLWPSWSPLVRLAGSATARSGRTRGSLGDPASSVNHARVPTSHPAMSQSCTRHTDEPAQIPWKRPMTPATSPRLSGVTDRTGR